MEILWLLTTLYPLRCTIFGFKRYLERTIISERMKGNEVIL